MTLTVPRGPLVGAAVARALCEAAVAALPPPDAALLFRAAVRAALPADADDLAVAELARTLERLAPVLHARKPGAALVLLTYTPGKAQPKITPWQGAAGGLWLD